MRTTIRTPQAVLAARRRFFEQGQGAASGVPPAILASWRRCLAHGLAAGRSFAAEPLSGAALREARERQRQFLLLVRPELEALHEQAHSTGSIVMLTDAGGLILDAIGHPDFLSKAARVALAPGVSWSEASAGTNAIGTALVERQAVEVRGGEHYFDGHRILSCSAMPIRDPWGHVAGVLDLSGEASQHHLHALGMVRLAVEQIEHRWFASGFDGCDVLRLHPEPGLLGTPREGILVFAQGRLHAANRHALAMLGLDWNDLGRRRYGELFEMPWSRLREDGQVRDRHGAWFGVRLDTPPRTVARPAAWYDGRSGERRPSCEAMLPAAPAPVFGITVGRELERATRVLDAGIAVLVQGETGTGKEVFARELHRRSRRAGGPFVAVNCAALPEGLIEAELFGYIDGAFTGARRHGSPGRLREADGGVLFLDEIGDMPLVLQARLLRVLQEREITPLGGGKPVAVDFAVLAATHRDLREASAAGRFREDLYYRIAQHVVHLPAVREMAAREALIERLWQDLRPVPALCLDPAARSALAAADWPGNLRQLVATLRSAIALREHADRVVLDDLPADLCRPSVTSALPADGAAKDGVARPLAEITVDLMRAELARSGGNVALAARRLGVSRSTLYRRLVVRA